MSDTKERMRLVMYPLVCQTNPFQGVALMDRKDISLPNAKVFEIDHGILEILRT